MDAKNTSAGTSSGVFAVVLAYTFFAGLWILLSDQAMALLVSDPDLLVQVSMAKGWFFVAVTSLLLYVLVKRLVRQLAASHQRELESERERLRAPAMLNAIVDGTEDAIFAKDEAGRYLLFNNAAARFVGKSAEEVIGQDDRALFPADQAEMLMAIGRRVMATGQVETNEEVVDTPAGRRVFLGTKGPLRDAEGHIFGIFGISRDITGRKQAELAVSHSERRFHDIVEASADWVWEVDAEVRYTYVSDTVKALLGYTPTEILGKTPFDLMPPGEAKRVSAEFQAYAARKAMFRDLDNINLHKDGSVRHVQTNGMPILAPDGSLLGYRGLDRDITANKEAEAALRSLADDMQATLQAVPDLLFEIDAEGRYLAVKASREEMLAAPPAELLGRSVSEVLPPEAAGTIMESLAAARQAGADYGRTIMLPLAQGTRYFEISVAHKPVIEGQADRFIVLSRDITARKAGEEELQQRYAELARFNKATVGRELDMIAMKVQINALSQELGRASPYPLDFLKDGGKP